MKRYVDLGVSTWILGVEESVDELGRLGIRETINRARSTGAY